MFMHNSYNSVLLLPALAVVAQSVVVTSFSTTLANITMPMLTSVGGTLSISAIDNALLTQSNGTLPISIITLPQLSVVNGTFAVAQTLLTSLTVPLLKSIGGLTLNDNQVLTLAAFPSLASISDNVTVQSNVVLQTMKVAMGISCKCNASFYQICANGGGFVAPSSIFPSLPGMQCKVVNGSTACPNNFSSCP